jgi:K+-sensing histidine kinase KdpD
VQNEKEIEGKASLSRNVEEGIFILILVVGLVVLPFWMSPMAAVMSGAIAACAFKFFFAPLLLKRRIKFTISDLLGVVLTLAIAFIIGYLRT